MVRLGKYVSLSIESNTSNKGQTSNFIAISVIYSFLWYIEMKRARNDLPETYLNA